MKINLTKYGFIDRGESYYIRWLKDFSVSSLRVEPDGSLYYHINNESTDDMNEVDSLFNDYILYLKTDLLYLKITINQMVNDGILDEESWCLKDD